MSPNFPQMFSPSSCLGSSIRGSTFEPNPTDASMPRNGGESDGKLNFIEDHYKKPAPGTCVFKGYDQPTPVSKYHLYDTSITWFMYGGKDFSRGGREQLKNGSRSEKRQQMGTPWNRFCGLGRNKLVLMEFRVNKIHALHELYPEGLPQLSRDVLFIKDIEVLDRLEISDINKFLHPYSNVSSRPCNPNMVCYLFHFMLFILEFKSYSHFDFRINCMLFIHRFNNCSSESVLGTAEMRATCRRKSAY